MYNENEVFFTCPYCFQNTSFLLEEMYGPQRYIEDGEVCCNPIEVDYEIKEGDVIKLNLERVQ